MIISKHILASRSLGAIGIVIIIAIIASVLGFVNIVHAETRITDGDLYTDTVWNASGSPYIIEDGVFVPRGISLTIKSGVSIVGSPELANYPILNVYGNLDIQGDKVARVSISGFGSMSNSYGRVNIQDADISLSGGFYTTQGSTTIRDTIISSSTYGIYDDQSDVDIRDSNITGNIYGIYVKKAEEIYQAKNSDSGRSVDTGGIGNAMDEVMVENFGPIFVISSSSISGNTDAAIYNESDRPVVATNNWWGTKDGPRSAESVEEDGGDMVVGLVDYDPWLLKDPHDKQSECCSSILFLPGLQASRLYESKPLSFDMGTTTGKLWEPLSFGNVQSLYLNEDGSSKNSNVYSNGVIDIALYTKGVYYKLMKHLDVLSTDKTINDWKAFAYDWREPIDKIVTGREKRATTTESLLETVTDLAEHSKTGKVTIVAHSNGGLIAKYLVKVLSDMGKAELVDKVISVAVPYLGTPQAVASLLHGSGQSIAFGLILKEYVARGLGVNMSSAYSLLPSSEYFDKVASPVITFSSSTVAGINNGSYPLRINDFQGQSSFIANIGNVRASASTTGTTNIDTSLPINGNRSLIAAANNLHDVLDTFAWPESILNLAIVGWNRSTTSGIAYTERKKCLASLLGMTCAVRPSHENILTTMGDGTVVFPSTVYGAGLVAAIDLIAASSEAHSTINHMSILESSTTLAILDTMLVSSSTASSTRARLSVMPNVTVGQPITSKDPAYLVVSTHSPVDLHVYDSLGNHTGVIPSPNTMIASSSIYTSFEANIPGSDFSMTDEGDNYVYVPDNGQKYRLEIHGTGVGEFTLAIERKIGATTLENVEYSVVPVTPLTVAMTTIESGYSGGGSNGGNGNVGTPPLASSTSPLIIDEDGDGNTDITVPPNRPFDPISYLELYKKTIKSIAGNTIRGKLLVVRINVLQGLIRLGKLKRAHNLASRMDSTMDHLKWKKLGTTDRDKILNMFDIFIQQFE